jgi:hypothetical protein
MANSATERALIEALAEEVSAGIRCGVDFWVSQIEAVFSDKQLTTMGRLQRLRQIVEEYRRMEGETSTMTDVGTQAARVWQPLARA